VTANATELTFRYERRRAVATGILETAATTFLLFIATRWFHAGATAKALIASGGSLGLLLSPLVVTWAEASRLPVARAASLVLGAGAVSFAVMTLFPVLPIFVAFGLIAMACSSAAIPLMTQVYHENYPERERGRLFSRAMMIRIAATVVFAKFAGDALTRDMAWFRGLLAVFAAAFAFGSYCAGRCPSHPLAATGDNHPLRSFRFVRSDRLFRNTLICWMLMGFANLMMFPLRVEYLANPKYGLNLSASEVALFVGVIPNLARLVLSPIWGWLFDHLNFFLMRFVLNLGFAIGILAFFTTHDRNGLIAGAIVFGVSNAGGDVAWGLWVTKFAPPDRVADYMSVHTSLTGLRGVIAPLAAFHLLGFFSLATLGWFCAALIVAATMILVPEIRFSWGGKPTAPLVEEVSE
jgi:MFS family permease